MNRPSTRLPHARLPGLRAAIVLTGLLMFAFEARAQVPKVAPSSVETAFAASLSSVSGDTRVLASVGATRFGRLGSTLWTGGLEAGYGHVAGLDTWDVEAQAGWSFPVGEGPVYPFLLAGGGLRQEHVGSFDTVRYPVGLGAGLRVLVSHTADVRLEYRFRRVLHDPVADYSEHLVLLGIGLLWGNSGAG